MAPRADCQGRKGGREGRVGQSVKSSQVRVVSNPPIHGRSEVGAACVPGSSCRWTWAARWGGRGYRPWSGRSCSGLVGGVVVRERDEVGGGLHTHAKPSKSKRQARRTAAELGGGLLGVVVEADGGLDLEVAQGGDGREGVVVGLHREVARVGELALDPARPGGRGREGGGGEWVGEYR